MEAARTSKDDGDTRITLGAQAGVAEHWTDELSFVDLGQEICLDLSLLASASPQLVVRVAAWLDFQTNLGATVHVVAPLDPNVASYLIRAGLGAHLPAPSSFPLASLEAESDLLLPLARIGDETQLDDLVLVLGARLRTNVAGDGKFIKDLLRLAMAELCANGLSHGHSQFGCYAAAEHHDDDRCVLAVGDLGIGIPSHVRKDLPAMTNDAEAIAHATGANDGAGKKKRGSGYGAMLRMIRRGDLPFARLSIWAGGGRHVVHVGDGQTSVPQSGISAHTVGSWIEMEIRAA